MICIKNCRCGTRKFVCTCQTLPKIYIYIFCDPLHLLSYEMAPHLDQQLREHIVSWQFDKKPAREIAALANCSEATVYNVLCLYRMFGRVTDPYHWQWSRPRALDQGDMSYIYSLLCEICDSVAPISTYHHPNPSQPSKYCKKKCCHRCCWVKRYQSCFKGKPLHPEKDWALQSCTFFEF